MGAPVPSVVSVLLLGKEGHVKVGNLRNGNGAEPLPYHSKPRTAERTPESVTGAALPRSTCLTAGPVTGQGEGPRVDLRLKQPPTASRSLELPLLTKA